jgi:uncharacterized protein (TIGR00297 family)
MSPHLARWLLALIAATVISLAARSRRSLNVSGMIAAIVSGTVIVGSAGWWAGLLLVIFFASSSILSHRDTRRSAIKQARGAERDAVQVLANGGVAVVAAILLAVTGNTGWSLVIAGAIAGASADTWSTEIGRTSRSLPRLVTNGRIVPAGTSGAVSKRGLLGALGGGALIGAIAALGWWSGWLPGDVPALAGLIGVSVAGLAGSLWDSLLGATVQDQRWCDSCQKVTEQRIHSCGTSTQSVRGLAFVDNDVVNISCTVIGGGAAWLITTLFI